MMRWLLACGAGVPAEPPQVAQARAALAASPPALDRAAELYQVACDAGHMPSYSALALQLQDAVSRMTPTGRGRSTSGRATGALGSGASTSG